jgi:peptidyl-prolyl cis-trans isomerase SurA
MDKLKKCCLAAVLCIASLAANGQNKDDVVFTIDGEPVKVDEFTYIYEKNNANDTALYTVPNLREYLELYKNFKLKVREARDAGIDTTEKFKQEYANYRNQLAQPYLTDRDVSQKLIDEAYERLQWELRASHILITVPMDAAPKDTFEAWSKAMGVYKMAVEGEDFEQLARKNSKDPSVANNGGDLGYFTAFQMIYPFESAAFSLNKVGDISRPMRTQFGYHIIKLTDKRPYRGEIKVRHILVNSAESDPKDKQDMAKNKADSVYNKLVQGASFQEMARQHSDHVQSRANGGELPEFNSFATYPEEFKDAAFSLKKDGDITKPFRTMFGWHILQRVEQKGLPAKKEQEDMLKQQVSRDSRSEKTKDAAIARFKKEYAFKENKKSYKKTLKLIDSNIVHGTWKLAPNAKATRTLFTVGGKNYTQKDFANWLENNQQPERFNDQKYAVSQYYKEYVDETVYSYQDAHLEEKYPEFRNVAQEYKEGIMLFEITDQLVWGKAMMDTLAQRHFYDLNKEKYRWKERADVVIFDVRDKQTLATLKKQLTTSKLPVDTIANNLIKKDPLSLNFNKSLVERGENAKIDSLTWKPGIYEAGMKDGRYVLVKVNKVMPPDYKQFEEIKGIVIADYQNYLEGEWLKSLKKKYTVVVNEDVVNALIRNKGRNK